MKKLVILMIISTVLFVTAFSLYPDNTGNQENIKIIIVHSISRDEYVLFKNEGDEPVNMKGMQLINVSKGEEYIFDDLVLEPFESIKLHSGPDASDLVWTYDYVHNDSTDGVMLYDESGYYVSFYRWGR